MVRWWRSFDFEGVRKGSLEGREGMLVYMYAARRSRLLLRAGVSIRMHWYSLLCTKYVHYQCMAIERRS